MPIHWQGCCLRLKVNFPALHEKVTYHNYEFEVLEMDSRRILKVKFTILPKEETEGAEDKSKMGLFLQDKTNDTQWAVWKVEESLRHCWLFYLMQRRVCCEQELLQFASEQEKDRVVVCPCLIVLYVERR